MAITVMVWNTVRLDSTKAKNSTNTRPNSARNPSAVVGQKLSQLTSTLCSHVHAHHMQSLLQSIHSFHQRSRRIAFGGRSGRFFTLTLASNDDGKCYSKRLSMRCPRWRRRRLHMCHLQSTRRRPSFIHAYMITTKEDHQDHLLFFIDTCAAAE